MEQDLGNDAIINILSIVSHLCLSVIPEYQLHTADALSSYLISHQSDSLRELHLDSTQLNGSDASFLMHAMARDGFPYRNLHLDISQNPLGKDHRKLAIAIAEGLAPTSLTMRMIEYDSEALFRDLIVALSKNRSIKYLDISRHSLPCDATEQTCEALAKMFEKNDYLEYLDISGEDSRLEMSRLGVGINQALHGLKSNRSLRILRINCGLPPSQMPNCLIDKSRSKIRVSGRRHISGCAKNEHNPTRYPYRR